MNQIELKSRKREKKDSLNKMRAKKIIPAVVYGPHMSPVTVAVDYVEFQKVYQKTGTSQIFTLFIGEKDKKDVLVYEVQKDPVGDFYIHIDFHAIKMDEKIKAMVPVKYHGVSPAVKDKGGILIKSIDELEVECFPKDLPREISVDLSTLIEINSSVRIKDLRGYEAVKIEADKNDALVTIAPPRTEQELASLSEKVVENVESVEGVKKEGVDEEAGKSKKDNTEKPKDDKSNKKEKSDGK